MRLFGLIALLLCAAGAAPAGTLSIIGYDRWTTVAYVFDGDTFRTEAGEKVRLLGINTPEVAHDSEPGEPLGNLAARMLTELIGGQVVRLKLDRQQRDDYGRLLAQVYRRDGTWVNGELVRRGLAHVYTFAPNVRWAEDLLNLERRARQEGVGIWQHERFRVLDVDELGQAHIGQFRLIRGQVRHAKRNGYDFSMGRLHVSVPRKYRPWFKRPPGLHAGQRVLVRGVIRTARSGRLFLALHTPYDLEMQPRQIQP